MSSKEPYFSVIIPTYNRAAFIETAIKSVLAQSFSDLELIVVDDGSTDNTEELVRSLEKEDARLQYIKQENKGRSTARNVGIDAAFGEYVCFLDSDDFWKENHLSEIHQAAKLHSKPTFFFTGLCYQFKENMQEKRFPPVGKEYPIDYVITNQVSTITVAIHREILKKQRFNPSLFINEDLELWARIVAHYPMAYINQVSAVAVQHDTNTTQVTSNAIEAQRKAMNMVFNNPTLKSAYSAKFKKQKIKSLLELTIREDQSQNRRWSLVKNLIKFITNYPSQPGNKSKLVLLIYSLPGGGILKGLIRSSNRSSG